MDVGLIVYDQNPVPALRARSLVTPASILIDLVCGIASERRDRVRDLDVIRLEGEGQGFCGEADPAYLSGTQEEGPAYLTSTQEEGPAYLSSTKEKDHAYLSSTKEEDHAYLLSAQASGQPRLAYQLTIVAIRTTGAVSLWHVNGYDGVQLLSLRANTILGDGTNGNTDLDSNVWMMVGDARQIEMARRGNGRRGGGRIGGRTGGHNGGCGRTPARQEYSEEGSVHTEPAVGVHGTEQTQVEEQPFTFEPEVRAAIA
ncbi:hypothetical protein L1987_24226 [Smallanthus sonchifolius]|uniref:Uncharacterized protein n=1 Tax=Smallanthus sonchifolius TaxID=185202 RepID=A0ACB9IKF7_9ASTR|nr:hypothetical protein L1987_24226 [Smallanthus sonchifolius]